MEAFDRARLTGVVLSAPWLALITIVLGTLTPGYSQVSDTISRLGSPGQPLAAVASAGMVVYGLLVLLGAGGAGGRTMLTALIALYGVAAVVAGLFPKDMPDGPHTATSQIHVVATLAGGTAIIAAMVLVGTRGSLLTAAGTVVAVIVFRLAWGSVTYGLVERVLIGLPAVWLSMRALGRSLAVCDPAPARMEGT